MSRDRDEAESTGAPKTEPRFSWLTGKWVAEKLLTFAAAALVAVSVASMEYKSIKSDVAGAVETANEAHGLVVAGQRAIRKFEKEIQAEVATIKIGIDKQTNTLQGIFNRQYGHLKDKVDARFDVLEKMAARSDERMKWLQEEQRKETRRAPAWQRDEWRRKKP